MGVYSGVGCGIPCGGDCHDRFGMGACVRPSEAVCETYCLSSSCPQSWDTDKVTEILEPHISGHPITYSHYLTETVQKKESDGNRKNLSDPLRSYFDVSDLKYGFNGKVNLVALLYL